MHLQDFNYDLPPELIARYPLPERSESRLLCLAKDGSITHRYFKDIQSLILPGDLLVCNNSRVIPARCLGFKETGGQIEMLVERILDNKHLLAQVRASKKPKPQSGLIFPGGVVFTVIGRKGDFFELRCEDPRPVLDVIEIIGQVPIPPYFQREVATMDSERYQTVYAAHKGSVAAPTAGLHFDIEILNQLRARQVGVEYVTLHVGAGTFSSVRVTDIKQHRMHAEYAEVSEDLCQQIIKTKKQGGRVIAVGTTTARSLETACRSGQLEPFKGETDIFIYPGFQFRCMDVLITNFHLPCSTLLMLVTAWGGYENVMAAYQSAVEHRYRFFSYGDAMWVSS